MVMAPKCASGGRHKWTREHAIVGGLRENPGVHGHGGGVVIYEACARCGCARITDTWDERRNQRRRTVTYEPGRYEVQP